MNKQVKKYKNAAPVCQMKANQINEKMDQESSRTDSLHDAKVDGRCKLVSRIVNTDHRYYHDYGTTQDHMT